MCSSRRWRHRAFASHLEVFSQSFVTARLGTYLLGKPTLGPVMSRVERHAVLFFYGGIEGTLHIVDGLRDKIQTELPVAEEVVEQACGQLLALDPLI